MINDELPETLKERLCGTLPGCGAQRAFEPSLSYGRQFVPPLSTMRPAAVMVLLYPKDDRWHIPLTVRKQSLRRHGGQISFPGGLLDYGESTRTAALRELAEELGVTEDVELLGRLTPLYVYVSNRMVTPWVGMLRERPPWSLSLAEVETLLEVPLEHLTDSANRETFYEQRYGIEWAAPSIRWQGYNVWGATAMMLGELLELVADQTQSNT